MLLEALSTRCQNRGPSKLRINRTDAVHSGAEKRPDITPSLPSPSLGIKLRPYRLAVSEPAGGLLGVVGEEDGGAGALDAGQDFEDDALLVEPAFRDRGFDHGVLAAHVVGADGNVEIVAHGSNHIEIGERGLDHYHVGAFFQIEGDFFQGFTRVCGILLIAAAVAELRSGLRGFAERAVKAGA